MLKRRFLDIVIVLSISLVIGAVVMAAQSSPPSPLALAQYDQSHNSNDANDKDQARDKVVLAIRRIGSFLKEYDGLITALATIVIAWFTFTLSRSTRRLWRASKDQLDLSKSALTDLERPYVFIGIKKAGLMTDNGLSVNLANMGISYQIKYFFENQGRTPALLNEILADFEIITDDSMPRPIDPEVRRGRVLPAGNAVGPNQKAPYFESLFLREDVSFSAVGDVQRGQKHLWMIGYVRYSDIFGRHFITGFCARYERGPDSFILEGYEEYNYTT